MYCIPIIKLIRVIDHLCCHHQHDVLCKKTLAISVTLEATNLWHQVNVVSSPGTFDFIPDLRVQSQQRMRRIHESHHES